MTAGWPVRLSEGRVGLRPLDRRDAAAWREVREANVAWLAPWEATPPDGLLTEVPFREMQRWLRSEARAGRMLPFGVTYDDRLVGQLTVAGISYGSMRSAQFGYWVDRRVAGRGVMPAAVALAADHCFRVLGLHRIEVNIRPENLASLRVVEKLGFRNEGVRERLLHIDGAWRDHVSYALTAEEVPGGLLARWRRLRTTPA